MPEYQKPKQTKRSIELFRIAGIQISIDYSWFIIFALILWSLSAGYFPREYPGMGFGSYWLAGLIATIFFFVSVILHELSHSLMAIRSGINIPEITLFIFGGVSRLGEEARDPLTEFRIAIVGPLSSFVLALAFWVLEIAFKPSGIPLLAAIFGYLAWINIALGVFNLIPGFPLDGGRILRAAVWLKTGSLPKATRWASDVGKGFAVALMVLGGFQLFGGAIVGGIWLFLIGVFLRGVAESGYQEVMVRQAFEGMRVEEVMIEDVIGVPPDLPVSTLIVDYFLRHGYQGFPVVRNGRPLGIVSLSNIKDLSEEEQKSKTVEQMMTPMTPGISMEPGQSLAEAMQRMTEENIGRLLVVEGDRLIGMITKTGLLRFLEIRRVLNK